MKYFKQKFKHDPENGIYGDCLRTCIACLLDVENLEDVPHYHGDDWPEGNQQEWFNKNYLHDKGLRLLQFGYHSDITDFKKLPELCEFIGLDKTHFLLCGISGNGIPHAAIYKAGKLVHDPAEINKGIVSPDPDGYYWISVIVRYIP